jgi:hypothetical protein
MKNPHAWRSKSILLNRYFRRTAVETSFLKEKRRRRNKFMLLRNVVVML